jgi:hypothetical protein
MIHYTRRWSKDLLFYIAGQAAGSGSAMEIVRWSSSRTKPVQITDGKT